MKDMLSSYCSYNSNSPRNYQTPMVVEIHVKTEIEVLSVNQELLKNYDENCRRLKCLQKRALINYNDEPWSILLSVNT